MTSRVKVGNVLNAYITAPVKEKVWTILGPEFVLDSGKSAIIVRALYGLNSLTPKSVPAGAKKILFGRYVLNIYVGIV
jgi:hypothetical protein